MATELTYPYTVFDPLEKYGVLGRRHGRNTMLDNVRIDTEFDDVKRVNKEEPASIN